MTDFNEDDPILQKVQKLVDKAWSTQFPAERDALLAKADALMLRYSLDSYMLLDPKRSNTAAPIKGQSPEMREMWYFGEKVRSTTVIDDYDIIDDIAKMFYRLAQHFHVRIGYYGWSSAKVVGYPADLDFLDMMFLSIKLHLLGKIDPHVTRDLTWKENLCALKQAGFKWEDIHAKLDGLPDYPFNGKPWRAGGKGFSAFPNAYNKWLRENPDEQANYGSPALWRRGFVHAYSDMIGYRLREMARESAQTVDNLPALLKSKDSGLDELFNELFPPVEYVAPPVDPNAKQKVIKYKEPKPKAVSYAAMRAGEAAARTADLNQRGARVGRSDDQRSIG